MPSLIHPHNSLGFYVSDQEDSPLRNAGTLNVNVLRDINAYLRINNPYVNLFVQLHRHTFDEAHSVFESMTRRTHGNVLGDPPRGNEVAAI